MGVAVSVSVPSAARVLPTDPIGPVRPVLAFPDRNALLHAIDREPARAKRFAAVRRARSAKNRDVTYVELARAMVDGDTHSGKLTLDFERDSFDFALRHARVRLVLEPRH